jgi:hypothetical protein
MFYVIQEDVFKEAHYLILLENMKRFNFDHEIVKYIPFAHEIDFKTDRKDVFCFGATSMAKAAIKYGWTPGSMLNANHDFEVYAPHYDMLNSDGQVISVYDKLPENLPYAFFARPTKDTKLFTGQMFTHDSWYGYVDECVENRKKIREINGVEDEGFLSPDTKILVAPLKPIEQEVRCWVVNNKVVTASRYKIGERVVYQNYDDETFYTDFANEQVSKFRVADAFVIDVCLSDGNLKVVEVNCFNCAGFYHANMVKMIEALEDYF